jgi:hypothetical protein
MRKSSSSLVAYLIFNQDHGPRGVPSGMLRAQAPELRTYELSNDVALTYGS